MDENGFRQFLNEGTRVPKNLSRETVDSNVQSVKDFEKDLQERGTRRTAENAIEEDIEHHAKNLVGRSDDPENRLLGILRYARFAGNTKAELAIVNLLDGLTVLPQLSDTIRERVGDAKHEAVFRGISLPELGSNPREWHFVAQKFMDQLEQQVDRATCEAILQTGPHAGPPESYEDERKEYLSSKDIDDFLERRHGKALGLLRKHMLDGTLFFTQEIDQSVLDLVNSNKEILGGVRNDDVIYETKIPYMAIEWLREEDDTMRRYYYCHCPWVREAIRTGVRISQTFCHCSAGYHKRPWDVIFGVPVEVDVLSSVLAGDSVCRFAIRMPRLTDDRH